MATLIKKGQPFARLATTQEEGGGRFWSGIHGHFFDSEPLYGNNPEWFTKSLKKKNPTLTVSLGWHETFLPYYGIGTNFPAGHPGIDAYTKDNILIAPFDMLVEEKWIDPNGGSIVDTSVVYCRNANGKGGVFGVEHARIIKPEPKWDSRVRGF